MGTRPLKFGEFKLCTSCKHHPENPKSIDDAPGVCWVCSSRSTRDNPLPLWERKETPVVHPYDAAFRSEEGTVHKLKAVSTSDGSSADYYKLPNGASQLQELISFKNMNAQIGEIFRACYRMGQASHSDRLRDAKKILFYAKAEVERLEKYADV